MSATLKRGFLVLLMAAGCLVSCLGTVGTALTLTWDPPVSGADGTTLSDTAGYKVYYGTTTRVYSQVTDAGLATSISFSNLVPEQTYYFAVKSYDTSANESAFSEELVWTMPPSTAGGPLASFSWSEIPTPQTAGVPFPITIRAMDANGVTVNSFAGSVSIRGTVTAHGMTTGSGTSTTDYPWTTANDDARTQVIYLQNEIGPAGAITALALDVSAIPGQTLRNWTIRMKHTSLMAFTNKSGWEPDGWTTVYQKDLSVSTTGWTEFAFSTPFPFNGTDNLMVDFSFNNVSRSKSGFCRSTAVGANRGLFKSANSNSGDPLTWSMAKPKPAIVSTLPDIRLLYDAPPVVIEPTVLTGFANGVWTGNIHVTDPVDGLTLNASDGEGHTGSGNPVDILTPPVEPSYYMATELPPLPATDVAIESSPEESDGMATAAVAATPTDIMRTGESGIPPVVSLAAEGGALKMGIRGTVGADLLLQASTNIANPFAWQTLQALLLTNAVSAPDGSPAPSARDTLKAAFVPAIEWITPDMDMTAPVRFFRVVMPYNYAVLADKVLKGKGYQTRLVVVRLPGTTLRDVCYVGEDRAYIASSEDHYVLALNHSGSTIREIADDYGSHVEMNWTSASEFVFTGDGRQLLATVVKTEAPASDPSPETSPALTVAIDF